MDVALVNFIGSGMIAASSGLGLVLPKGAARDGYHFVDYLSRYRAPALKDLLESLIEDIWSSWQTAGIPRAVALEHLEKLPSIIEAHAPSMGYFVSSFAKSKASGPDAAAGSAAGRAITAETIMQAREINAFEKQKLNEQLCHFFLERLFVALLSRPLLFDDLKPAVEAYLSQKLWLGVRHAGASDQSLPSAVTTALIAKHVAPASRLDNRKSGRRSAPAGTGRQKAQPTGNASDQEIDTDEIDALSDPAQLQTCAQRYRALSVLATHKGNLVEASRLQLLLGRVLHRLGLVAHDAAAMDEAASLLSAALEHFYGSHPGLPDSAAGTDVEPTPHDAQQPRDEIDRTEIIAAQLALGDLLWHLSTARDNVDLAAKAVATLEALCARLRQDADASIWVKAHIALGSIHIARSKTDEASNSLAKAVAAFEAAAEAINKRDDPLQWATVTSQLAGVYGASALRSGDHEIMAQAVEMKLAALDVFESEGADEAAELIHDELHQLHEDVQRLSNPAGSGTTAATIDPPMAGPKAAAVAR